MKALTHFSFNCIIFTPLREGKFIQGFFIKTAKLMHSNKVDDIEEHTSH
jgi:hypothetical protein